MKKYTAVIRTLGRAGEKYQRLLDSLLAQTMKPEAIIVYIAEGYDLPTETVGVERYVRVKKGMVAQRALQYEEVKTDYILFLDDDVYLPASAVAKLFEELEEYHGDVIAPDLFNNHRKPWKQKIILAVMGKEICRFFGTKWAFKITSNGGFSYINNPNKPVYRSQTNGGPCFLCRKEDFLRIKFDEESWLDEVSYALPDDQVMFYKMHKYGLIVLTSFDSGVIHLDASTTQYWDQKRIEKLRYSEYRNKYIFWHRFIYMPSTPIKKAYNYMSMCYFIALRILKAFILKISGNKSELLILNSAFKQAKKFVNSKSYKKLPKI